MNALQKFYQKKLDEGKMPINDKMFFKNIHKPHGVVIVPKDGSYIRFISNTWYA